MNLVIKKIDWNFIFILLIFSAFSLSFLYTYDKFLFQKQLVWYIVSFIIIVLGIFIKWEWFIVSKYFLYGFYLFCVFLLFVSNLQSGLIRGTKSWLSFGFFNIEPVEIAKLSIIFLLSNFFAKRYLASWQTKNIFTSFLIVLIPSFLTFIHPDLGSTVVLFSIWIVFMLLGGIHKRRFVVGVLIFAFLLIVLWSFFLKDYQKLRIIGFLFPEKDPLGLNYNLMQSKIAIGSGGFWGKGFGGGTQSQLRFLPEAHTDFIFASLVEQWGFVGGFIILLTFFALFYKILNIILIAKSNHFKFFVLGFLVLLTVHLFINIGSNIGITPVTGITLPFVSYGGSSLLTIAILFSIIQRIKFISS